jgi:glutamine synthetase
VIFFTFVDVLNKLILGFMSTFRQRALNEAATHGNERYFVEDRPISSFFGVNVFDRRKMRRYMSKPAYEAVVSASEYGTSIDRSLANEIATGMKTWAIEMGATHYTHIIEPLTGLTAEKHEAFVTVKDGDVFERFSGTALVQQEPDGSSFPSGGLRNTFEARGYSAWDPTSPVYILGQTLCIPSIFVSYNGEAIDMKVPNLKAYQALNKAAVSVANLFDENVTKVIVNIGLEQEYFLVDESLYKSRPDLALCDRTVIGHTSAKDQQLSDHYQGTIPQRALAFMKDFETEAYKLGIELTTRHNEVAPNQFECAPKYCEMTKAIDQNMLLMTVMQQVAEKHHLKVILHEKPFAGVNGSGKHTNWSMQTDTGVNLLSPGSTPTKNLQFLAFYSSVLKAIHNHNALIMTSVCTYSNSFRLGGNEAPPAVMSVFSGSTLSKVFDSIIKTKAEKSEGAGKTIKLVNSIPEIFPDNTDRNRTSPFAFTGNRFEFRAVGSSVNVASVTYVLNAAVAEALTEFRKRVDSKMKAGSKKNDAVMAVVKDYLTESQDVCFEGNGYSAEWFAEAKKRGLKAITNFPDAYKNYLTKDSEDLFVKQGILTKAEIEARYEVLNETYVKKLQIEARVIGDLCLNHVIPAAVRYQDLLIQDITGCQEVFKAESKNLCKAEIETYKKISGFINNLQSDVESLVEARKKANAVTDIAKRAKLYSTEVMSWMEKVRYSADHLEMLVDDELWPMPKYRELLFF